MSMKIKSQDLTPIIFNRSIINLCVELRKGFCNGYLIINVYCQYE